ncbi:MAG: CCA tRNA nucleotidyltransferase [Alphaproteobacteria bacterium]|nr:CCA tRNA nucleotidyltransferase [Alphaproteobacteria bacterium]
MTEVSGAWLENPRTQSVLSMLTEAGYQAFVVGGAVRDALLDIAVSDVDIATDALPETVIALAQEAGLKAIPTGIDHGTITVVCGDNGYQITTFRKDIETDGRHAVVTFSRTLAEDALRRDFTINALYATAGGHVVDPLGGLPDIAARRVRFIGLPEDRIREDSLRILRFFRFHACFSDPLEGIDATALAACAELADQLETLSKERIGVEMRKLLGAPDPAPSAASMSTAGILMRLLPGASTAGLAPLVHYERAIGLAPDWMRRLAVIGGQNMMENLRLSRSENRQVRLYLTGTASSRSIAELAFRHDAKTAQTVELLRAVSFGRDLTPDLIKTTLRAEAMIFPVRAGDLVGLSGAAIGTRLHELQTQWIASDFQLSKLDLLK